MKKRPSLQGPAGVLLMTLAGVAVGVIAARSGFEPPSLGLGPVSTAAFVLLLIPLLYMLVIAAHEIGHVAGGVFVGFRPLLFIVGPLRIERTPSGGRRYGLNRSFAMAGGLAACAPVGTQDLRQRAMVLVAGGPVASFVFSVQCLAIHQATVGLTMGDGASPAARLAGVSLLILGVLSLLIGMVTLLPMRTGGFYSDGARLLRLMRAGEESEREVALLALSGLSLGGVRPADWDPALVDRCSGIRDGGPFEVTGRQLAYTHALDRGDVDIARTHLDAVVGMIDQLPAGSRTPVLLSAVTFYALYDDDAEPARALLARAGAQSLLTSPHDRVLAEAALKLADGDTEGAFTAACEVQRLIAEAPDRGGAALDYDLAGRIIERARAQGAADAAR